MFRLAPYTLEHMGMFNTFTFAEKCARCGETFEHVNDFKDYGERGYSYSLGDRIVPSSPRDRKLRYLSLGAAGCGNCHSVRLPKILVIRGDVCESIRTVPDTADAFHGEFRMHEIMLLTQEHPVEAVVAASRRAWECHRSRDFNVFTLSPEQEKSRLWFREIISRPGFFDSLPKKEQEEARNDAHRCAEPEEYLIRHAMRKPLFRETILAALSTPAYFKPEALSNFVAQDVRCPRCSAVNTALIPFKYGPVNGYQYRVGVAIDWGVPGRLMEVRDRELRYIEVSVPACDACGYAARGMVTVENDAITDIFVWPKELLEVIEVAGLPSWNTWPTLDHFLNVREFGVDVYLLSLEQRNDAVRRYDATRALGGLDQQRDSEVISHFYDRLIENYKRLRKKDYVADLPAGS